MKMIQKQVHKIDLTAQISSELTGFWADDVWDIREYPIPLDKPWKRSHWCFSFEFLPEALRTMFKFYFYKKLSDKHMSPGTVWPYYGHSIKIIGSYIQQRYPTMKSILDIPIEKFMLGYQTYLHANYKRGYSGNTRVYRDIYRYFEDMYDEREETEKDRWDVRKLGINFNLTNTQYFIDFSDIPMPFRDLSKRYIKDRLVIVRNMQVGTAIHYTYALSRLFQSIVENRPSWKDIRQLNRDDILLFINKLRKEEIGSEKRGKRKATDNFINRTIIYLETFLSDIQRYEWGEAPLKSISRLIYPEDKPKLSRVNPDKVKYIPDEVWDKLLSNINLFPPEFVPIILLFEATGFRGSDIMTLKLDCLQKRDDGWWISGDQMKVKYKEHRVPINEDVAKVVAAQIQLISEKSINGANPDRFLFPRFDGKRINKPMGIATFNSTLNRVTKRIPILDKNGSVYHFKNHAFRHRYGVNLVNNGMSLVLIKELMAHVSIEMTLVYAKIKDTTLREQWERAREKGALRLSVTGDVVETDIETQAQENGLELEWIRHNLDSIRLDHGLCVKSPKVSCDFLNQTLEPPCIKNNCRSFHVDTTFLSYYQFQIDQMERDILVYKQSGRTRSIEIVEPKLKRYRELADSIQTAGGIFGLPKAKREYVGEEKTHG